VAAGRAEKGAKKVVEAAVGGADDDDVLQHLRDRRDVRAIPHLVARHQHQRRVLCLSAGGCLHEVATLSGRRKRNMYWRERCTQLRSRYRASRAKMAGGSTSGSHGKFRRGDRDFVRAWLLTTHAQRVAT
jgi:hypothetical protein